VREGGGARVSTEITRAMEKGRMELGGSMVPRRERKKGVRVWCLAMCRRRGGLVRWPVMPQSWRRWATVSVALSPGAWAGYWASRWGRPEMNRAPFLFVQKNSTDLNLKWSKRYLPLPEKFPLKFVFVGN
jgi:hypothetical protein